MSSSTQRYDAVILGAGVLGLSIADELTQRGKKVAIVARDLPEDVHSAAFASPWAGANWASYASTPDEKRRDTITWHRFAELVKEIPDIVQETEAVYAFDEEGGYSPPWYKDLTRNFRELHGDDVPVGWKYAYGFGIYTLNPPAYLAHLYNKLRTSGVPIIRQRLSALDEAYALFGGVNLVINATGLGARSLLGVEDPKVFPARGQTVLVKAPQVRQCMSAKDSSRMPSTGLQTYIIPRPGPDGHVILGGTFLKDNYSTLPDMAQAERILKETYKLCPALSGGKGWKEIEVVSHNVGLRPAREGGARVELEEREVQRGKERLIPGKGNLGTESGEKVGVVHAYGIGPAGYQASIGIAIEAADLVEQYLGRGRGQGKL